MILLREIQEKDLDALERFAQIPGMFNLPGDRDLLKERIQRSRASFAGKYRDLQDAKYTFVAEDLETKKVIATSMIAAQHGTAESPHYYFEVGHEKRFSEAINTGFIHGTLTLKIDTDGPSEIGALVVDPGIRNDERKIGRQVSFVRFFYVALNRSRFRNQIIAELLPPLNKRGLSPLWEAIGRRFTNMDYWEADQLSSKSKEFIFDLFPTGKIYTSFLSAEARNAIGKVGKDTAPVVHMLKRIGFTYKNQIDPFDGGPHFWAEVEKIAPVKNTRTFVWKGAAGTDGNAPLTEKGLLASNAPKPGEFRAIGVECVIVDDKELALVDPARAPQVERELGLKLGDSISFMPYY